jgi:hypothetical protein
MPEPVWFVSVWCAGAVVVERPRGTASGLEQVASTCTVRTKATWRTGGEQMDCEKGNGNVRSDNICEKIIGRIQRKQCIDQWRRFFRRIRSQSVMIDFTPILRSCKNVVDPPEELSRCTII